MRQLLALKPPIRPQADMEMFLDRFSCDDNAKKLTFNQQLNLIGQSKAWQDFCKENENAQFYVFDVARDPALDIDSKFMVDHCATFRTNNSHLWLLARPDLEHIETQSATQSKTNALLEAQPATHVLCLRPVSLEVKGGC